MSVTLWTWGNNMTIAQQNIANPLTRCNIKLDWQQVYLQNNIKLCSPNDTFILKFAVVALSDLQSCNPAYAFAAYV